MAGTHRCHDDRVNRRFRSSGQHDVHIASNDHIGSLSNSRDGAIATRGDGEAGCVQSKVSETSPPHDPVKTAMLV